jgi:tetratricopeptide (TPR) repeat protein
LLLDRRRIKYWQKWIYALMAVLMVAFLIYIPLGSQGCGAARSTTSQNPNDHITALKKQLRANPGATAVMVALAQAYQLAAGQQATGSAQQKTDYANAAVYYKKYLDATKDQKSPQALRTRIETLQILASVYSNVSDYAKAVGVYEQLTAMQPQNADFFAQLGQFAISAKQTNIALLAFTRYLQLAPNSPDAKTIRDWVRKNTATASASPKASPKATASASSTASAKPTTSPSP